MSTKMGRSPCCDKLGLKKGPWTPEEDQKLLAYIEEHGHGNWRALPSKAGLQRCGKSCRLRWTNYLRPDIKRGKFSLQEEQTIIQLHALLGNRWSAIATHLPKRTDNEIKNYWNTHLKKRLTKMGIDPVTHKPKNDALHSASDGGQHSKNAANLSHMAQWESARLEAEARLVRQSKLRLSNNSNNTSSFNNCDPHSELHLNDHHYITMSGSTGTGTSPTPRCLDVFKAWQRGWTSTSTTSTDANNDDIIGISIGSTTGIGGGVGVGIESPTSTLSFSENAPPVPVVPNMGNGAVIEFMGHHQNHDQDHHHMHNQEMGIKKEGDHHHIQHSNEHEWMSSLSFMPSHHINEQRSHDYDHQDQDQDHDKNHDEAFMDGFTELLLSTNSTTTKTSVIGDNNNNDNNNNNNNNNNNDNNSSGTTTTTNSSKGSGSDYYEDNKTYWNSILNLVNSSPSHSPMF